MNASPARRRSGDLSAPADKVNPSETYSITFEWPLHDLKQQFDSSNSDTKSKVIKSVPFGQGRWTVLFYAQSGLQQFCSLYLNAEPTLEERNQSKSPWEAFLSSSGSARSPKSLPDKANGASDDGWTRKGLFRFTFKILTLNKGTVLATKEAFNHAFSHKTSNWGWAQFASRDTVFYSNSEVQQSNAFVISVTITASAERPRPLPEGVTVPPALIEAMGSLLDDPDHSDVVFIIRRKRRHPTTGAIITQERRIYAIKKILASRCEYFRDMFEGGFLEADATTSSDDEVDDKAVAPPPSSRGVGQDHLGLASSASSSSEHDQDDDLVLEDSDEEMEVDEVYEMGRTNFNEQRRGSEAASSRIATSVLPKPAFTTAASGSEGFASPRLREPSSDAPQARGLSSHTTPLPADPPHASGYARLQQNTPPQSRTRPSNDHDAETDSGEEATRAQGMSAFQTPQHSPRSSRGENARLVSPPPAFAASMMAQPRSERPLHEQAIVPSSFTGRSMPQRRKSGGSPSTSAHSGKKRRKVIVRDAAYATYKALLYYLYTDTVAFAPLHSHFYSHNSSPTDHSDMLGEAHENFGAPLFKADEANGEASAPYGSSDAGLPLSRAPSTPTSSSFAKERRRAHAVRQQVIDEYCATHANVPATCSAKSMYRLADKLQIPELKKRAQDELANNLTVDNIVWEVFSGFNSQFPAIRKMETDFLLKHWSEVKGTEVMKSIFSRPSAHPGLADVWPHLLSQLEFRGSSAEAKDESPPRT